MIKALALSILNSINHNDYHRVIVKTAKMRLLANKVGIRLSDILPTSVLYVTDKVLKNLYARYYQCLDVELCHLCAIDNLRIFMDNSYLPNELLASIASLLNLPKLPA